jgi:peptide/nickel transport system permease protein
VDPAVHAAHAVRSSARYAGLTRLIVLKLARLVAVVFAVAVLCFLSLNLLPGDPARAILGLSGATPDAVHALDIKLGLNHPLLPRFVTWLGHVLHGNLGSSYQTGLPVMDIIRQRAPITLELIVISQVLALLVAVPTAIIAAVKRGTVIDRSISLAVFAVFSTPSFVLGFILIWVFAVTLGLYPATGYSPLSAGLTEHVNSLVLPSITLASAPFALYQRVLRADLVETYRSEFMAVARAKGVPPVRAALRHAMRPSLVGLTTSVGVMVGTLIGGAVIVEQLFGLPGLGAELVTAASSRDYVEVQGIVLVSATFYVVVNTAVDLLYTVIDPRGRNPWRQSTRTSTATLARTLTRTQS